MQMVNYLVRDEALHGEAQNTEGYSAGRPILEKSTRPPGVVPVQMQVIGLIAQPIEGGQLLIRTFLTNVPPTGG